MDEEKEQIKVLKDFLEEEGDCMDLNKLKEIEDKFNLESKLQSQSIAIKEAREVIEFYAKKNNYWINGKGYARHGEPSMVDEDEGAKAQAWLDSNKEE